MRVRLGGGRARRFFPIEAAAPRRCPASLRPQSRSRAPARAASEPTSAWRGRISANQDPQGAARRRHKSRAAGGRAAGPKKKRGVRSRSCFPSCSLSSRAHPVRAGRIDRLLTPGYSQVAQAPSRRGLDEMRRAITPCAAPPRNPVPSFFPDPLATPAAGRCFACAAFFCRSLHSYLGRRGRDGRGAGDPAGRRPSRQDGAGLEGQHGGGGARGRWARKGRKKERNEGTSF